MLKVSVIIPVKNEEATIADLLESLRAQTFKPDEIVIADGGSTDNTIHIINEHIKTGMPIKLIQLTHAYPGKGRNVAIENCRNNIVASIDAGCIAENNWLDKLVTTLEKNQALYVVFGTCKPVTNNLISKCVAAAIIPDNWLSVASMIIKKEAWIEAGKFREDLRAAEDNIFIQNLKKLKSAVKFNNEAIVYWRTSNSLSQFFKQYLTYSKNLRYVNNAFYFMLRKFIFYLFLFIFIGLSLKITLLFIFPVIFLFFSWVFLSIRKHSISFREVKENPTAYLLLPIVILTRDISALLGYTVSFLQKLERPLY